jgi:hypothetical protein
MPLLRIAALLATLCFASAAAAGGDVCLVDSGNQTLLVLKRLKVPKRGGEAVPVSGFAYTSTSTTELPLSGTLVRSGDGDLLLGLTRHFQRCLIGAVLDDTLGGTVSYDCNLDNANDTTGSLVPTSCTSL